ncbi:hypothetical protein AVEN_254499-1 [Araneus ventricosus]|uniref:Uncharacterized protein n=1 Tax=Araneus ventricosus TaxID=182803 RepID=A0A4Y2TXV7_ARAVE|nr:hypothetical protein AVEN_254499-1 [Araneus ventricosus]
MASPQEQVQYQIEICNTGVTYISDYLQSSSRPTIYEWHERFMTTGRILPKPKFGCPSRSFDDIKRIQETFCRSPRKLICSTAQHLQMPISNIAKKPL